MRSVMVVIGLVAIACSAACAANGGGGSTGDNGNGDEAGGDTGNGGDNNGNGGNGSLDLGGAQGDGGNPSPSGAGGSPDLGCTGEGDFQACAQCFAGEDPTGGQAYQGTLLDECACTNPAGDCYAACSGDPVCTGQQPGAECNSCIGTLSNNSACVADFSSACMANPDCNAFASQLAGCPQ